MNERDIFDVSILKPLIPNMSPLSLVWIFEYFNLKRIVKVFQKSDYIPETFSENSEGTNVAYINI